ncbi:ABC transporter permease [Nocardioides sp.]|uniref:ABC transporter permease n=1 Tax=Nocardioides sp. TaxID=35761 RepID=UPI0031FED51C|nr:gsiC 4 [Nocardioides sp.]
MGHYMLKRLLLVLPTLVVPVVLIFTLLRLAPGDPAVVMLGNQATADQVAKLRESLGLDQPIYAQFGDWLGRLLHLDLGHSIFFPEPVLSTISDHGTVTLQLTLLSFALAVVLGVGGGMLAALYRNRAVDRIVMVLAIVGVSLPEFWFGLNLILIFAVRLQWFPVSGYVPLSEGLLPSMRSLVLPAVCLGMIQAAFIARLTRSTVLDVLSEPFVTTARSKGLPERIVVFKHIARGVLVSILSTMGVILGLLLSGAIAVEVVFALPGLGRLLVDSVGRRDYPVIQGVVLITSLTFVAVNLLVDFLYAFVDPRVRYE